MSNPRRIIITGANGFIGSYLTEYFSQSGYSVIALVRNIPPTSPRLVVHKAFSLGGDVDEDAFDDADYLIHCAYASYPEVMNARELNLTGTRKLINLSRQHNLKKLVFLSSMSAHEEARSVYGKSKRETELLFDLAKEVVLKPGLVIGDGGLFKKILLFLKDTNIIPLIGGGRQQIQTIFIEDLACCIKESLERDIKGLYPVASPKTTTLRDLYHEASLLLRRRIHYMYLPYCVAQTLLTISELLKIKLSFTKENLLGLRYSRTFNVDATWNTFNVQPRDCEESIRRAFQ